MMVRIRVATPADSDELARLRWDFRVEHGTPVTRTFEEFASEFRTFVTDALAEGAPWRAWVAHADRRLVGCLWLQLIEKVPHPSRERGERPIAYVTNAYVEPGMRDAGLGSRLLDVALAFAREQRMAEAIVWPTPRSVSYRRAGFGTESAPLGMDLAGN